MSCLVLYIFLFLIILEVGQDSHLVVVEIHAIKSKILDSNYIFISHDVCVYIYIYKRRENILQKQILGI